MSDEETKMLLVTDVTFWRNRTGAEQRIFSLLRYLEKVWQVETLFCGTINDQDHRIIARQELKIQSTDDDPIPKDLLGKFWWHFRGTVHMLQTMAGLKLKQDDQIAKGKPLKKFRNPRIGKRFAQTLQDLKSDIVIVEYVSLAYLTEFVPRELRAKTLLAIDTHDLMHSRNEQFKAAGYDHWVQLTREQEKQSLEKFDLVLAIQDEEQKAFEKLVPSTTSVTVSHAVSLQNESDSGSKLEIGNESGEVVLGYFGSSNASNETAIRDFLQECWPMLLQRTNVKLVIAGTICGCLGDIDIAHVKLVGIVEQPSSFYDQVDIVLNPVSFGTGLKIKNLEALAFCKPLVTTPQGVGGMKVMNDSPFLVADTPLEMVEMIERLIVQPEVRNQLADAAKRYISNQFCEEAAYQPLITAYEELSLARKKP